MANPTTSSVSANPPAVFRGRLAGLGFSAAIVTLFTYALLKVTADESFVAEYPFGIAACLGLVVFLQRVTTQYLPRGIRVDEHGMTDLATRVSLSWSEVSEVKFELLSSGNVKLRVATIVGDQAHLSFADLEGVVPPRPDITDTSEAGLLLAIVAVRSGAGDLFPKSWASEGSTPASDPPPSASASSSTRGPGEARNLKTASFVAMVFKLGPKLWKVALALLKTVKPGAVAVSIAAYALIFSWRFALALVVMILVHECGHVYAMWRCGVNVKGIYFVPFFGGLALAEGQASTRKASAYIAINGPVWGTLFALFCMAAYLATGESWAFVGAMAAWGALINLFNLLPILPLDGGRLLSNVAHSSSGRMGVQVTFLSLVLGAALAYLARFELLVLMVILGLFEFGSQLAALPLRPGLALLDKQLGPDEYVHFARWVSVAKKGSEQQQRQRRAERFASQLEEARQRPMSGLALLATVGGYFALAGTLIAVLLLLQNLSGAGDPLHLLK